MKHLKNTGRSFEPPSICQKDVLLFQTQKMSFEPHERSSIDAPVFTKRMVEKEPDRVWELLDEYLCAVRDNSGISLAAWTQVHKKLILKEAFDDNVSNYGTQDAELIERASIIQESYHGQDNTTLEDTRACWTDLFCAGNQVLFTELHQMLGGLDIWEYAKKTQKLRNVQKAYLAISHALFGDNIVFFRSEAQKKAIDIITYCGNKGNFDLTTM